MKKRIIAMALALVLAVSSVPAEDASAAEQSESNLNQSADNETQDNVDSNAQPEDTEEYSQGESTLEVVEEESLQETQTGDYSAFHIGENGKVAGNNGIFYDDVTYLSLDTVAMLEEDAQNVYLSFCDEIASMKENGNEIEDVVIAADDEGNLHWSFSVPGIELARAQVSENGDGKLAQEAVSEQESSQDELLQEEYSQEEVTQEETAAEELSQEESSQEESSQEELFEEESSQEELSEKESTQEELSEEETVQEESTEEESSEEEIAPEESSKEELSEEETLPEALSQEEASEEKLTAENMELLAELPSESVEEIEEVYVEPMFDLGYGNADYQIKSTLPTKSYFYNQLNSTEKKIYNAASGKLTGGNNSFSFTGPANISSSVSQAISAVMMTHPAKTEWMDPRGGWSGKGTYTSGSSSINWKIVVQKSKYYSSSLESQAKNKIKTLAKNAQEYAVKNYPNAPVYGIVKYFDKWICENNYYNYVGVYGPYEEAYYYCHSSYGILLKGYGVCESYAKALSRLLDSIGIPNFYVVGDAGGGHAWNYVQMPNGSWYMVDSTWNDGGSKSSETYLLCPNDGRHKATGTYFSNCSRNFTFPSLASSRYIVSNEKISLNQSSCDLQAKKSVQLTCNSNYVQYFKSNWSSSNTKVAKVNSKGKVTGVAPGTATITLTIMVSGIELSTSCKVNVYQVKKVTFDSNGKTSNKVVGGIAGSAGTNAEAQKFVLNADCGNGPYSAQQLVAKKYIEAPVVKSSNEKVAKAACSLNGNKLNLTVYPIATGNAKITVKFGGKTVTLNYSVKQKLNAGWFDTSIIKNVSYTGKAYTPKITLKASAPKGVSFKVKHTNNKNAGTATVTISGTGKYSGDLKYTYKITPVNITAADFSACTKSKVYNGGTNTAATTVKFNKKKLAAGKDYTVYYNGKSTAVNVGTYTVTIKGKGNYTGTVNMTKQFQITANNISKMTVSCPASIKYTGSRQTPVVVKIGKNVLPASDYQVTYHKDTIDGAATTPVNKGKYVAVITPKGKNVTTKANKTQIVKKFVIK